MAFLGGHRPRLGDTPTLSEKDMAFVESLRVIKPYDINYGMGYSGWKPEPGDLVVLGKWHVFICGGPVEELAEMKKCAAQGLRNLYRVGA